MVIYTKYISNVKKASPDIVSVLLPYAKAFLGLNPLGTIQQDNSSTSYKLLLGTLNGYTRVWPANKIK